MSEYLLPREYSKRNPSVGRSSKKPVRLSTLECTLCALTFDKTVADPSAETFQKAFRNMLIKILNYANQISKPLS